MTTYSKVVVPHTYKAREVNMNAGSKCTSVLTIIEFSLHHLHCRLVGLLHMYYITKIQTSEQSDFPAKNISKKYSSSLQLFKTPYIVLQNMCLWYDWVLFSSNLDNIKYPSLVYLVYYIHKIVVILIESLYLFTDDHLKL